MSVRRDVDSRAAAATFGRCGERPPPCTAAEAPPPPVRCRHSWLHTGHALCGGESSGLPLDLPATEAGAAEATAHRRAICDAQLAGTGGGDGSWSRAWRHRGAVAAAGWCRARARSGCVGDAIDGAPRLISRRRPRWVVRVANWARAVVAE